MESVISSKSAIGCWWFKLGKYQLLITLFALFVHYMFSLDERPERLIVMVAFTAVVPCIVVMRQTIVPITVATIGFLLSGLSYDSSITMCTVITAASFTVVTIFLRQGHEKHGLSKTVVWASSAVQFLLIVYPMLAYSL